MENIMMQNSKSGHNNSAEVDNMDNIILPNDSSSLSRNKSYILIGAALTLLFFITLAVINTFSNENNQDNSDNTFIQDDIDSKTIKQDRLLNDQDIFQKPTTYNSTDTEIDARYQDILKRLEEDDSSDIKIDNYNTYTEEDIKKPIKVQSNSHYIKPKNMERERTETRKIVKITPAKKIVSGKYYVQVGAFSNAPDKVFIKKITKLNYSYSVKRVNGINKVLVGAFNSRAQAEDELPQIRKYIASGAYITRTK